MNARLIYKDLQDETSFDAVVVGAGASGGLAALELTRSGLRVLVLDAGWPVRLSTDPLRFLTGSVVRKMADPRLQSVLSPALIHHGQRCLRLLGRLHQPIQTRCFAWPFAPEAFVSDRDRPYATEGDVRFDWFRAEQIGGRMIIPGHGRQYLRLSERDFNPHDSFSPGWPLQLGELTPWYERVEALIGLQGGLEECAWVPAGHMTPITPNSAELEAIERVKLRWPKAEPILGRAAAPLMSVAEAEKTGRLTVRSGAIVSEVVVKNCVVTGVRWYDRATRTSREMRTKIVFLCASTLESTRILLSSTAGGEPPGARSKALGRFLMDHIVLSAEGEAGPLRGEATALEAGRCIYLPRFDLRSAENNQDNRGYGVQLYRWSTKPGKSQFHCVSFAEMLPRAENYVTLDRERPDAFGIPTLRIRCLHNEAERAQAQDQSRALRELGEVFGVRFTRLQTKPAAPGTAIHECGTARMGSDPASSVLDPHNQCWDARGLYVTDGACFPSQGAQNPTLTIMALTSRACAHAVYERSGIV